jgi:hypothetical protein
VAAEEREREGAPRRREREIEWLRERVRESTVCGERLTERESNESEREREIRRGFKIWGKIWVCGRRRHW